MVVPGAFDVSGRRTLERLVPEPLLLEDVEAVTFCANSLVVGDVVVMPACPPRVGRWLEGAGFDVAVVDTSEFMKAGGACRCLTLPLDIGVVEASFGVAA
jgi:N-dimethylarginine dimethylaminohydrolase